MRKILRIVLRAIYSFVLVLILFVLFVIVLGGGCSGSARPGDSGCERFTVMESKMSPNSVYLAEVIAADYGVMHGAMLVRVTRQNHPRNSREIYRGNWDALITLRWETDEILYINENKYVIRNILGFGGCLSVTADEVN